MSDYFLLNDLDSFPHGSVSIDDTNMTHFVADDLEFQIKIASPVSKREFDDQIRSKSSTPAKQTTTDAARDMLRKQFLASVPQIDANVLNDIEIEAQYLAANVDNITENLCNLLHSVKKEILLFFCMLNKFQLDILNLFVLDLSDSS